MKVSTLWLREWVHFSLTEQELAHQLTMAGLEVDAVHPVAGAFSHVVVAQVLSTKPHPNADKLTLCEVDANTGTVLQVVCGASNVRPGLKVALAMIGAQLPGDFRIKESKLRGELSQGMLCSLTELGLADHSEGIMELESDAPIGMNLREYLLLDDMVLDIDLTPNRADCFSVLGIAREVAVLNKLPLTRPEISTTLPVHDDVLPVVLKDPKACPKYCGRIIRGINSDATTPLWMAERLRRAGLRTVHPVVDVLNYVMLELGQPMHAFDLAQINGAINVRFAEPSEQLCLLDGQNVTLNEQVLVIADNEKPLAMAGVMGGASSAVSAHTHDIFLESAFFNPIVIAGTARKHGLFSDSSQRFERGVDPQLQLLALERATALILAIVGGEAGPIIESRQDAFLPAPVAFTFDTHKVERLTGLKIAQELMHTFLEGLGITVHKASESLLQVHIPSHRFDLQQDVDLVEEIIRLYGYDNLKAQPMNALVASGKASAHSQIETQIALWFKTRGYNEAISYSFVDPELQESLYPQKEFMQLLNPISSELSQMRSGMWPGLIASMIYNLHRQQNAIRLFETGVVFDVREGVLSERACIAGLLMGERGSMSWNESTRAYDFYDLKGDVASLCAFLNVSNAVFVPSQHDALHPGKTAEIIINDAHAGWLGVLHPKLADALDVPYEVVLFELEMSRLMANNTPLYRSISKYPHIRRDLSFLVDEHVSVGHIEAAVRATIQEPWLTAFDVFDVYTGPGIPDGKKSIALAITLQDSARTLVDAEINLLISAIIKTLENEFSIMLRD